MARRGTDDGGISGARNAVDLTNATTFSRNMDMLGDLAMEDDEEFPELSEDKDDVLECVRNIYAQLMLLSSRCPRPLATHRSVWC